VTRLLFLRHGDADHPGPPAWDHDSKRPLTGDGKRKMSVEARGMRALGLSIDVIVTSPYLRARQTADQVAHEFRLADRMVESELVEPGSDFKSFQRALKGIEGDSIMIVGHAPDLGLWVGELTGLGDVPMGKGTLAWVKLKPDLRRGTARLLALLPAELLVAAGEHARPAR
jgi:phosphohistidine phosphatase